MEPRPDRIGTSSASESEQLPPLPVSPSLFSANLPISGFSASLRERAQASATAKPPPHFSPRERIATGYMEALKGQGSPVEAIGDVRKSHRTCSVFNSLTNNWKNAVETVDFIHRERNI